MKINDIKRILLIFLFTSFFISCSSVKQDEKKITSIDIVEIWERKDIININFKADADISLSGTKLSAVIKGRIAAKDSASFTIVGPFGITVAKAYINKNYVLFYDSFNNRYFSSEFDKINNSKNSISVTYIQLLKKMFDFIRNEYIKPKDFRRDFQDKSYISYKIPNDNGFDIVEFDKNSNFISKITNSRNNNVETTVNYLQFEEFDNIFFPKVMDFKFYNINVDFKLEFSELKFNDDFNNIQFNFTIPKDAEKISF